MKAASLAIFTGLELGGIAYWTQSYNELNIQESSIILTMWTAGAFFGALALMIFFKEKPWRLAFFISGGFVLAVFCRIVFDVALVDRTHHNLWPLEVGLCGILALPSSLAGAYLYFLFRKYRK
jgi:hypothetical protein